jgi:cellulose biosynthesis protein BcsQ
MDQRMRSPPFNPSVSDVAPSDGVLTGYDEEHLVTYLRLLDAEAEGADDPLVLAARIGQRVAFADAAQFGRLVAELDEAGIAAREIAALAREIAGLSG